MTSRRRVLTAFVAAATLTLVLVPPSASAADPPRIERRSDDPRWVDGAVDLAVPPDVLRAAVGNMSAWPQLFSDVSSVGIKSRSGARQVAAVHSRILGGHPHDFTIIDGGSGFDVAIDVTGADARGTVAISPGAREGTSRAVFSLYAVTSGLAGIFLSEAALRGKQEAMVRTYVTDLGRLERR